MPTILRERGYRFFFFSNERNEPPHIHVERAENYAKFWLSPVRQERNYGFRTNELTEIKRIIENRREALLRAWNEYFGDQT